jgi:hypothetical protein
MRKIWFLAMLALAPAVLAGNIGTFTQASDVGAVKRPLTAAYDSLSGAYTLGASGDNIWDKRDGFGYLWKQVHGDAVIGATVNLKGKGGHAHRKAGLMFRQSLEPDSVYVDIVVHGDGLTSLQYRSEPGGPTREIQCATESPYGMRLEKRGDYIQVSLANDAGLFSASGCGIRIALRGTFYSGLVMCAHDDAAFETAEFKHVGTGTPPERPEERLSAIEILAVGSLQRRIAYISRTQPDSPSFTADGAAICFRSEGQLLRLELDGASDPVAIGPPNAELCAVAAASAPTALRLSHEVKGGHAQIWRAADGGAQTAVTQDRLQNWQPRLAPTGESFVFLSGAARPDGGRIAPGDYLLREMPARGGAPRELASFFGGPGSIGASPWSPDGTQIVFISREPD